MNINNTTLERAIAIAKKDGAKINNENAECYVLAALAQEINFIKTMLNTAKGSEATKVISSNTAYRLYTSITGENNKGH